MIRVKFGNVTVSGLERFLGISFNEADRKFLEEGHFAKTEGIPADKWHCFEKPILDIRCGSIELSEKIAEILAPYAHDFKEEIKVSFEVSEN